jgi:hypothetical protein
MVSIDGHVERLHEFEREVATALADVLATGNCKDVHTPESPIATLCLRLEYHLVTALFDRANEAGVVDIWFDGFLPNQVELLETGIAMSGACWFGRGADASMEVAGPFEAEILVRRDSIDRFELRFGDADALRSKAMLSGSGRFDVAGYNVTVRAHPRAGEWPLEISRR